MGESFGNRKGRLGQTCSKGKILVCGLERVDILEFGEGLSDSMGLMEVPGFGCNLFWMERLMSLFQSHVIVSPSFD